MTRTEQGAALVEAAIVVPIFALIAFAIIEFGAIYQTDNHMGNATRAGARLAQSQGKSLDFYPQVVEAVETSGSHEFVSGDVLCIYPVNTALNPQGTDTNCNAGRKYIYNGTHFTGNMSDAGYWSSTQRKTCLTDRDSVGISLMTQHKSVTGFFGKQGIRAHTVMALGPECS